MILEQIRTFSDREEVIESCRWTFDDLGSVDEERLAACVDASLLCDAHGAWNLRRKSRVKWALLAWEKGKD